MCQGSVGAVKVELAGVELEQRDAVVAEAGERPGRRRRAAPPAVLGRPASSRARASTTAVEPAGGLEAERGRHGVLQQRSRDHQRLAVIACERRSRRRDPVGLREHERERPAGDEHRGRVDDVLARRAAVHVPRRLVADRAGERTHERLGRVADGAALLGQLLEVEAIGVAGRGDLGREVRRHGAGRSHRRSRALARRRASPRATPGTTRRPAARRGRRGRRTPTCRDRSGSRRRRLHGSSACGRRHARLRVPTTETASWIFDMACDIQHANGRPRGGRARLGGP